MLFKCRLLSEMNIFFSGSQQCSTEDVADKNTVPWLTKNNSTIM